MWKLSGRGRRVSNAARKNNANKLFRFRFLAAQGTAHPGDSSHPVPIVVSPDVFARLFPPGRDVADLRHL